LAPGRYQLRIGARETNGGRIGSVSYDLDVPNFTKDPVSLTGLLIASARTVEIPTPQPDPMIDRELSAQPTTVRTFAPGDTLRLATHLYVNGNAARAPVEVETSLNALDGRVVFRAQDTYQPTEGATGYVHVGEVPLADVAPGTYVLRIAARSGAAGGNASPVAREVPIEVAPQGNSPSSPQHQ
jgi:hypothetical protein